VNPERRGFSRRHALRALGLGGLSLGGLPVAAGCRSAVGQAAGDSAARPQAGGTLNAGITADLIPGNIMTNSTAGITTVVGLVYEGLIRYAAGTVTPAPRLATSWSLAHDGLSLTLNLRDDVRFHTGRAFTSEDVAFSITTYADPTWNGQMASTAQAVTHVDTSAPHRAVLHFAHRLGNIFDLLDTVPIIDRKTVGQIATGKRFVGTGPFVFESWTPNSELVFRRNKDYYVAGRPYLDGVHVSVIPDASSLTTAVRSVQVDFANGVSYRDIEELATQSVFHTVTLHGAEQQTYVGANVKAPPLDDLVVRQAIAYSIDRDRVVSEVFRNSGAVANLPWPTYSLAYDANRNSTYTRSPAKAKKLLAGRSIPTIPLTYPSDQAAVSAVALIVQSNLKDVGVPVELDPVDSAQFIKLLIGGKFEGLWTTMHSWAQFLPSTLTVSAYPFNASKNASGYSSARYSADADAAWRVAKGTSAAAVADYRRLSDDLLDSLFLIEIGVIQPRFVRSGRLHGVSYTKRAELDLTDAYLA
jgi:peptide/nickel transport system substrate-binding protein